MIGAGRLVEMMLTGRSYDAEEGQRPRPVRLSSSSLRGVEQASRSLSASPATPCSRDYAILKAIPRIEDMAMKDGLFTESPWPPW